MNERWSGNAFQVFEATDKNDSVLIMVVFRGGTHGDNDEEERNARVGTYFGMKDARKDGCWNCNTLKVIAAILKLILQTGSQCRWEEQVWWDSTKNFERPLEQKYSWQAGGESDFFF